MITLTPEAIAKVKTLMGEGVLGLRVGVLGGGCSGFTYKMSECTGTDDTDLVFPHDGLNVYVDQMSHMYLDGVTIDYQERIDGAGFKFNNPAATRTCGCGQSFSA